MSEHNWGNVAKTTFIINHLNSESKYLDTVIECSLEIQEALRKSRVLSKDVVGEGGTSGSKDRSSGSKSSSDPSESSIDQEKRSKELTDLMSLIRHRMSDEIEPILPQRRKFAKTLRSMVPDSSQTPSLTELAKHTDEPHRTKLRQLRTEIRGKIRRIQTIAMGNQAVLIYTMDFFNRLLTGISPGQVPEPRYNAAGRTPNQSTGKFIHTNC
ncbi:MAG: flagellar export chaperone FlgN [Mariniblastus sp.]